MEAQVAQFLNRGMNQDISVSKASNEFAFRNYNIRITAIDANTLLSVTNEKGPLKLDVSIKDKEEIWNSIKGNYLGHASINDFIILFTKDTDFDYIYKLEINQRVEGEVKFKGDLKFDLNNPIECLVHYDSEKFQKVYWIDGKNITRVININEDVYTKNDSYFDFNPKINEFPSITSSIDYSGSGQFPSGVIQYYISYYNAYGSETGIVAYTDLIPIAFESRGASPEEIVNCSFNLTISNIDTSFEYIRVYSIQRTSLNGPIICKIVSDIKISDSTLITIQDSNIGEIIDSTSLLFLGGDEFIASTITQKDNTLFLGDITTKDSYVIDKELENLLNPVYNGEYYESPYLNFRSIRYKGKHFKKGEWYRIGIQFQTDTAKWTAPIWLGDIKCNVGISQTCSNNKCWTTVPVLFFEPSNEIQELASKYYKRYRLLMAETSSADRSIIAQGIVSPTVFNWNERVKKTGPYAIGSWIARSNNGNERYKHLQSLGNSIQNTDGSIIYLNDLNSEIQNTINKPPIVTASNKKYLYTFYRKVVAGSGGGVGAYYTLNIFELAPSFDGTITNLISDNIVKLITTNTISSSIADEGFLASSINSFYKGFSNISYPEISSSDLTSFVTDAPNYTAFGEFVNHPDGWYSGYVSIKDDIIEVKPNSTGNDFTIGASYIIESDEELDFEYSDNNNFYIDSSILTFHSPDLEDVSSILNNASLNFRIVGTASIDKYDFDISLKASSGASKTSSLIKSNWNKRQFGSKEGMFINGPVYQDYAWKLDGELSNNTGNYFLYLWNKKGSIIGQTSETKDNRDSILANLEQKIVANKRYSSKTRYFDYESNEYYNINPIIFNADSIESKYLSVNGESVIYQGNYENLITPDSELTYRVFWNEPYGISSDRYLYSVKQYDPVSIKFNKLPHAVFSLKSSDGLSNVILPYLSKTEKPWNIQNIYSELIGEINYPWLKDGEFYSQYSIDNVNVESPYFFIAEIYRDISYDSLYGGTSKSNIERLNWIPLGSGSDVRYSTSVGGDTYYGRWECLNTVPSTESDLNSVVDIVSFLVESRINLDGRYDKNKDSLNILNARSTNFNKFNNVYTQKNNYFTYNILRDSLVQSKYPNQIAFSLAKEPNSIIDTWTNISLVSAFNLDGSYGRLNKIINFNDTIIAFQDKAVSTINFNNRTALSTESGVPIEIANSGKVNGYSVIIDNVGCQNKQSICQASSGIYFIDDLNKTLYNFNKEGLSNISSKGMSVWFKKNLTTKEKVFYDYLTQDLYITNEDNCLVYNENLQSFVSFMDYYDVDLLCNLNGNSFILNKDNNKITLNKMFAGKYTDYYSVEYKINPEPLVDKIFTNVEYTADFYNTPSPDLPYSFGTTGHTQSPFGRLRVWNEYQEGIVEGTALKKKYPNFEKKFRTWRVDIPRDRINHRDRIRNPWIMLELSKSNAPNNRMVFHNLLVKYYK